MAFFHEKNISQYVLTVCILLIVSYIGSKFKHYFEPVSNDDEMIRKYLLNDNPLSHLGTIFTPGSPLHGHNRPKLWIHTVYEYNARMWASFGSRSSYDLNQPYLHLTVRSIIKHCGKDFDICLIDDDSFRQLIPDWMIKISQLSEPYRSQYRDLAIAELLHTYGGFLVPNSFLCFQNLIDIYNSSVQDGKPVVFEQINRHVNLFEENRHKRSFTANPHFMGVPKRCPVIRAYADFLKSRLSTLHCSSEDEFIGKNAQWFNREIKKGTVHSGDGLLVGVKDMHGKPIMLEDMMEEDPIEICPRRTLGILIPMNELLKRNKYQWFAVLSMNDVLQTHTSLSKYIRFAISE